MAKVSFTAGAVTLSNDLTTQQAARFSAFAVGNYKAADGTDLTPAVAVKAMLRATYQGMSANVVRWENDQKHAAVVPSGDIVATEDP